MYGPSRPSVLGMASIRVAFGRAVRRLRTAKGLTQEAFAGKVKLDRAYTGRIERGEVNISLDNIQKIAKGLGISLGDLMAAADDEL